MRDVHESEVFEGAVSSADEPVIRGVKLLGLRSRNRRNYDTDGVRKTAPALLEGARVYIDHPSTPEQPRSYRDAFGVVEGYEYRPGAGHFGNIRYNPDHPLAKQFVWDVKNSPKSLGMSVNARIRPGKTDKGGDIVVESLEMVRSVDIVTKPATADGIFEHEEEDQIMDLKTLKEKHADLVEQLLADVRKSDTESEAAAALQRKLDEAMEQLEQMKAAEKARELRAALEADFASLFKDSAVLGSAELQKEVIECACELAEPAQKKFRGLIEKISKVTPMLEEVDDDELPTDDDSEDEDEPISAREDEQERRTYRPNRGKDRGKSLRDIWGAKKS